MKIRHIDWKWSESGNCYEGTIYGANGIGWALAVIFEDEDSGEWHLNYESKDPSENILKAESFGGVVQKAYMFHKQNFIDDFLEVAM